MNQLVIKKCIFCNYKKLYNVSTTQMKCASCMKKFSVKKLQLDFEVIKAFCDNLSAKECSEELSINYRTVTDRYTIIRKLIIRFLEENYYKNPSGFNEYDEYYYLPQNKRGKVKYLFEAIGVLGMVYQDRIYTLILPDQFSHLDTTNSEINMAYLKEYAKHLNRYKIIHYKQFDNLLIKFWVYLENSITRFKGVSKENFIYYLKELEFKFNYEKKRQQEIIWELWLESF